VQRGAVVDEASSYVGLRKISVGPGADGTARLLVNGKPLFQFGFLDQGFWPDGLHTPPTDEAMRFDIASTLGFGMNLARKHIKIEPDRWYYWPTSLASSSGRICRAAATTRPTRGRTSPASGSG